jgi:FkbM family methyltransferase
MGLYGAARDVYQLVGNRALREHRRRVRDFFSQFVHSDDLVFDVGANDGRYTSEMLALGGKVVAVEPTPELAALLRRRYPNARVVEAAAGAAPGKAVLHIGLDPIFSTLSDEWMAVTPTPVWSGESLTVQVVTLDDLIAQHGTPQYLKIDVEGYEADVLAGLSQPLEVVSFEVQGPALHLAAGCFNRLADLGHYEFNISIADRLQLEPAWMSPAALEVVMESIGDRHGDVFARRL